MMKLEGWSKPKWAKAYHFFPKSHQSLCGEVFFDEERDELWNVPPIDTKYCKKCFLEVAMQDSHAIFGTLEPWRISSRRQTSPTTETEK